MVEASSTPPKARRANSIAFALSALFLISALAGNAQRLVLIDQDGSGPGGSNQMSMMVLLQSPQVKVLGITMVSGNAWEPEEVQHTLRMLELIHRTDVPVVPGAIFPLLRTEAESRNQTAAIGSFPWYGAWGDLAKHTSMQPYHGPFVVPFLSKRETPPPGP
jgi:purine nucleosidase